MVQKKATKKPENKLHITQICVGQWEGDKGGSGFCVVGLGDDGVVYQYRKGDLNAWVPFSQDVMVKA